MWLIIKSELIKEKKKHRNDTDNDHTKHFKVIS